jgi:hypothetical protein
MTANVPLYRSHAMEQKNEQCIDARTGVESSLIARIEIDSEIRLGFIVDISIDGLAVRYADLDYKLISPGKLCRLDLRNVGGKVLIEGITARVVYDRDATVAYPYGFLKMNKIAMEFGVLPSDQAERIELLLSRIGS